MSKIYDNCHIFSFKEVSCAEIYLNCSNYIFINMTL